MMMIADEGGRGTVRNFGLNTTRCRCKQQLHLLLVLALCNLQCFGASETRATKSGKVKMEGGFHILS